MFRSCCEWVQANQPVSTTGVIAHSARWVTAMNGDLILTNPRVNKSAPTTTIYCIHGTADYNAAFLLVANRLLPKLPDSIEAIHLCAFESRFKGIGIDDFANQLKDKIQANGHQDVILMGHSRGGLVAAYFTENLAQDSHVNVKAVFAICSPF